jgi:hypothetical protein
MPIRATVVPPQSQLTNHHGVYGIAGLIYFTIAVVHFPWGWYSL